jgi:hypothetical protein
MRSPWSSFDTCIGSSPRWPVRAAPLRRARIADRIALPFPRTDDARDFARSVHDLWGVGDKDANTGIVVFFAVGDRGMFVSTGSGARALITDAECTALFEHVKPLLREARWDAAVHDTVGGVMEKIRTAPRRRLLKLGAVILACAAMLALWFSAENRGRRRRRFLETKRDIEHRKAHALASSAPVSMSARASCRAGEAVAPLRSTCVYCAWSRCPRTCSRPSLTRTAPLGSECVSTAQRRCSEVIRGRGRRAPSLSTLRGSRR